jgi:hypothetical protein
MADATLPSGWTRHHHRESGVDFYVHEASGETQWQPPADDGLAPGWHAVVDEATGETYYAHAETHATSWAKPRSGWAKVTSGDDVYYAHRGTEETTWERPAGYESPAEDDAIDAAADAPPADAPAPPRGADVGDGWHRVLDPDTQTHYYAQSCARSKRPQPAALRTRLSHAQLTVRRSRSSASPNGADFAPPSGAASRAASPSPSSYQMSGHWK